MSFVAACAPLSTSPSLAQSARESPNEAASGSPMASTSQEFRVTGAEAMSIATVVRFIGAINAGDVASAATMLADDASVSDCDFAEHSVLLFSGLAQTTQWLEARVADHEFLGIGAIYSATATYTDVLGLEFSLRSSDSLRNLGAHDGIRPLLGAKVVLDDQSTIRTLALAPGGADMATIKRVCGVDPIPRP
jgi:hypothetical protein